MYFNQKWLLLEGIYWLEKICISFYSWKKILEMNQHPFLNNCQSHICQEMIIYLSNFDDNILYWQVEDTSFEVDAEIKSWSCKRCTLENPGDLSICQACGGSKLRSLEHYSSATSSKSGSWTCSKCTLKNPIGAQKCRVCETSRKIPRKIKCAACTYENSGGAKKCEMCNSAMHTQKQFLRHHLHLLLHLLLHLHLKLKPDLVV